MAIAHVATEYVFSDFLLKDPTEAKYKGVRLELAVDKIVTFLAVGLPLFLISLAFAQEVSVGELLNLSAFIVGGCDINRILTEAWDPGSVPLCYIVMFVLIGHT